MKYVAKDIRDSDLFPVGTYQFMVKDAHHSGDDESLFIRIAFKVEAPEEMKNRIYFHTLWLGTKADPQAKEPATRGGFGFSQLKSFLKVIGLPMAEDTEEDAEAIAASGASFLGDIKTRTYKSTNDGEMKTVNDVRRFYQLGKKDVGLDEAQPVAASEPSEPTKKNGKKPTSEKCPECGLVMDKTLLAAHVLLHNEALNDDDEE